MESRAKRNAANGNEGNSQSRSDFQEWMEIQQRPASLGWIEFRLLTSWGTFLVLFAAAIGPTLLGM